MEETKKNKMLESAKSPFCTPVELSNLNWKFKNGCYLDDIKVFFNSCCEIFEKRIINELIYPLFATFKFENVEVQVLDEDKALIREQENIYKNVETCVRVLVKDVDKLDIDRKFKYQRADLNLGLLLLAFKGYINEYIDKLDSTFIKRKRKNKTLIGSYLDTEKIEFKTIGDIFCLTEKATAFMRDKGMFPTPSNIINNAFAFGFSGKGEEDFIRGELLDSLKSILNSFVYVLTEYKDRPEYLISMLGTIVHNYRILVLTLLIVKLQKEGLYTMNENYVEQTSPTISRSEEVIEHLAKPNYDNYIKKEKG